MRAENCALPSPGKSQFVPPAIFKCVHGGPESYLFLGEENQNITISAIMSITVFPHTNLYRLINSNRYNTHLHMLQGESHVCRVLVSRSFICNSICWPYFAERSNESKKLYIKK